MLLIDSAQKPFRVEECKITTGSGASFSLHMTHGTPVSKPTAIFAAQLMYE